MAVKKSEEGAKTFIVTMPETVDGIIFTVMASAEPPYRAEHNIFWLRARELGTEMWGQTIWADMENQEEGLFVSKKIKPAALWLVPDTTYEIEVAPETLKVCDFELGVQVSSFVPPKPERVEERKVEIVKPKESVIDNPIAWMVIMGLVFLAYLIMLARR